jgi:AcrR family transcriptional regulator
MEAKAIPARDGARARLLDAALVRFAREGALGATLDEIRADAGVSVGALYHHFGDKQTLAAALFGECLADYQQGFVAGLRKHPGAEAGVREGVRFHLRWCARNPDRARVLLGLRPTAEPAELRRQNKEFYAEVMAWWRPHVHYGALRDLDLDITYALWLGPSQEYTRLALAGRVKPAPRRVADDFAGAAWLTLGAPTT